MQKYIDAVLTSSGTPAAGASVSVTVTATGLPATIYSDNGSTVISGSTVTADASGEYAFYAANGRYTLTISYSGYVAEVRTDVVLFDPTDGITTGTPAASSGFWPDVTSTTKFSRMRDRVFVGGGAAVTGNRFGTQGGFVPTGTEGASWAPRDSTLYVAQDTGLMAVTGFASNANIDTTPGEPTETIGVSGFVINNKANRPAWGLYSDIQHEAGSSSFGLEVAGKNKGSNYVPNPYGLGLGVYGVWLAAGGDASYGGAPTNPSTAGIVFKKNASTWNVGMVFENNAITGTDGVTGTGVAVALAKGHQIQWHKPDGTEGLVVRGDQGIGEASSFILGKANAVDIAGAGELTIAKFLGGASTVNYFQIQSSTTGNLLILRAQGSDTNVGIQIRTKGTQAVRFQSQDSGATDEFRVGGINSNPVNFLWAYGSNASAGLATLQASGADTNISIRLTPKGTGTVSFGTWTSNADAPVNGYVTITDSSGNTRKLATIA